MTLTRRSVFAAAAVTAVWPAAVTAETRSRRMRDAYPYLREYYAIPAGERSRFVTAYYLELDGQAATSGISAVVIRGGARTPMTIGRFGRLPTPSAADLAGDAQVEVTWPTGRRLSLNMRLEPSARPAAQMPAAELAEAIAQCGRGVRRVMGVMGMAAPRLTRIGIVGAASGEVVMADGRRASLPRRETMLSFTPADFAGATTLAFPSPPSRLQILSA